MLTALLATGAAFAACGLEACPIEGPGAPSAPAQLLLAPRYTAAPDGAAWYSELFVGARLRPLPPLTLGLSLPLVLLRDPFGPRGGAGDGLAFVDLGRRGPSLHAGLGVQVELPTATHADAPHLVALPYARVELWRGAFDLRARAGWGRTLPQGEAHSHTALPRVEVNPHADSELLAMAELGWSRRRSALTLRPALGASLARDLQAPSAAALALGPSLELQGPAQVLRLSAERGLSPTRRFDHRLSLTLTRDLTPPRRSPP